MKRRSFLSAVAGLLAAPFVSLGARPEKSDSPIKRITIDWYRVMQEKLPDEPADIGFLVDPPPLGEIRYRVNNGEWQKKGGPLPLRCGEDFSLSIHNGRPTFAWCGEVDEVCWGNPDLPLGVSGGFADFNG